MTKKMFLTVAAVSLLSGGLVMATDAFAQTNPQRTVPSLVQEIAQKFNLNKNDVQAVFIQHRQEMQQKKEANYEKYLSNLVTSNKITEAQEQSILNEHKELVSQMQSDFKNFKSMTPAQRKTAIQALRQDAQNWAKQNAINIQYLRPFVMKQFVRAGMSGHKPTPTP